MEKVRNLSIRKAIVLYMSVSLLLSFVTGAVIMKTAERTQEQIWWKYVDEGSFAEAAEREEAGGEYIVSVDRPSRDSMTKMDWHLSELCDFLQTYSILVLSIVGVILAVMLFYRDKIKHPLQELTRASRMIAENELDFQISYSNQDELGRLCRDFERMRSELEKNNRRMWHMVEEEKVLRAAIAHDIRTPLAVLEGYQEMLLEFISEDMLDKEKTIEMLHESRKQIGRINDFIESMRRMSSLEHRELEPMEMNLSALDGEVKKSVEILCADSGNEVVMRCQEEDMRLSVDIGLVLEVVENIVSNALRYAKRKVEIDIAAKDELLEITVSDDGTGFDVSAEKVTTAYYHSNPQDDLKHFGLGMYISKVCCEKHGGRLLLGNRESGGAVVKAEFKSKI